MEEYLIVKLIIGIVFIWVLYKNVCKYIKQKQIDEEIARRKEYHKRPDYKDF